MVHFVGNFAHALVRGDTFLANWAGLTVPPANNSNRNQCNFSYQKWCITTSVSAETLLPFSSKGAKRLCSPSLQVSLMSPRFFFFGLKNINDNCTRQVVLCERISGYLTRALFFHFYFILFYFFSKYFLTIKLRQGGPKLVTTDHLKILTWLNVSDVFLKSKTGLMQIAVM